MTVKCSPQSAHNTEQTLRYRQVQETVTWLTSESMVLRYLHSFKKAFWTNDGTLKPER